MKTKKSKGFILVFFGICLALLLAIGGLSVDVGSSYYQKQLIQRAADMASLAAVLQIHSSDANVQNVARSLLDSNGVDISGINTSKDQFTITCGKYNGNTKKFEQCGSSCQNGPCPCSDCQTPETNAVKIQLYRVVPSFLTKVLNINYFTPKVISVATASMATSNRCLRPFGIEEQAINGVSVGSTFTVGRNSPGNWGRLDLGQGGGSGQFEDAMMNGFCSPNVYIGASIPPSTGNANSITDSFTAYVNANQHKGLIFGLTTPFGNGNKNVTLVGFAIMDFVSQTGNGNSWQATFRLTKKDYVVPPFGGGPGAPNDRNLAPILR